MNQLIIDPLIWFANREVSFVPRHFTRCPTPVTTESKEWIKNKSKGRYVFTEDTDELENNESDLVSLLLHTTNYIVYFENHEDAIMYELLWARVVK